MSKRRERAEKRRVRSEEFRPPILAETKRTILLVVALTIMVLGVLVAFGVIPLSP